MAVLNLRNVPEDLKRRLAAQAAAQGKKFHAYCVGLLRTGVEDDESDARAFAAGPISRDLSARQRRIVGLPPAPAEAVARPILSGSLPTATPEAELEARIDVEAGEGSAATLAELRRLADEERERTAGANTLDSIEIL